LWLLTESRTTENIKNREIMLTGYKVIRVDSKNRRTGGAVVYYKENIRVKQVEAQVYNDEVWTLKFEIGNKMFVLLYRSPSQSGKDFIEYFKDMCENYVQPDIDVTIVGDFNIDVLKNETYSRAARSVMRISCLRELLNEPTRYSGSSATQIDWVLTTRSDMKAKVLKDYRISDHEVIEIDVETETSNNRKKERKIKYRTDEFQKRIVSKNWDSDGSVDGQAELFTRNLRETLEGFVVEVTNRWGENSWFNSEAEDLRRNKNEEFCKGILSGCMNGYRMARNKYVNKLKELKNNETVNELLKHVNDKTKMWKTLKKL
jgi:hypothetical protein